MAVSAHHGHPARSTECLQLSDPRTWRRKAAWTLLPVFVLNALIESPRYGPGDAPATAISALVVLLMFARQFRHVADVVAVEGEIFRIRKGIRRFRVPAELVIDVTRGSEPLLGRTIRLTLAKNTMRLGPTVEFLPVGFDSMLTSQLLERIETVRGLAPRASPAPAVLARDETASTGPDVVPLWVKILGVPYGLLPILMVADETFGFGLFRGYARQTAAVLLLVGGLRFANFVLPRQNVDLHREQR